MASLANDFSDAYTRVSEFLGLGSSPTGADATKCKNYVYRGYIRFLFPINPKTGVTHIWNFLRRESTLVTEDSKWVYMLPADFGCMARNFEFDADDGYPPLEQRTMAQIRGMRAITDTSSYPRYFAIGAGNYTKATGQKWEVRFHYPPNGVYSLNYSYLIEPDKPTGDDDYFVGGVLASECIIEHALAAAELEEDDLTTNIHQQEAQRLLLQLMSFDIANNPNTVGTMSDSGILMGGDLHNWKTAITEAFGVTS